MGIKHCPPTFTDSTSDWCYEGPDGCSLTGTLVVTASDDGTSNTEEYLDVDGNPIDPASVTPVDCVKGLPVEIVPGCGPLEVKLVPDPTGANCDDPTFVDVCPNDQLTDIAELLQELLDKEVITVDTEYVCNADTGVWDRHTIVTTDGVPAEPTVVPTTTPCEDEPPIMQDPEISWVDNCVGGFIERQLYQVQFIDNVAQPAVAIGDPIVTTTVCGEDVVVIDTEYVCNTDTNVYDQIVIVTTNDVAADPVITPTLVPCDEEKPDFEQVRVCRNGVVNIVTTSFLEDGTPTELSAVPTEEICAEPVKQKVEVDTCEGTDSALVDQVVAVKGVLTTKPCPVDLIEVDTEVLCNEDTNVWEYHQITTTNGVPALAVVTPTAIPCDEEQPDFEYREYCDLTTRTLQSQLVEIAEDQTPSNVGSPIDKLTPCVPMQTECVESQEWTYALDNTGTTTDEDAVITLTLSDGSTVVFNQTSQGAVSQWTPQMAEWGANIQTEADNSGLAWFVETRYIVSAGSLAGGGGFSGPPSVPVSNALYAGGMRARYVNIQICPGQPVPVSAVYESASKSITLTTAGAVLGPINKFQVCRSCGTEPVWYLADGITPVPAGQIPNCYEPCGTLALTDSPPDRDCEFQTIIGCDNNNSDLTTDFIPNITRRAQVCDGTQIAVDYFQEDPNDSSALILYPLVGEFVDCATGEPFPLPAPPCSEFNIIECPPYQIYPAPITDGGRDITQEENDGFPLGGVGEARNFAPWLPQYVGTPPFPISGFTDTAPSSAITDGFNPGASNTFRTRVFPFGLKDGDIPTCTDGTTPDEVELNLNLEITGNHSVAGVGDDVFIYILDGSSTTPVLLDTVSLVGAPLLGTNIYSLATTVSPSSLSNLRFALSLQTLESNTKVFNWDVSLLEVGITVEGCEQDCVRLTHDQCAANQRKSANDLLYQVAQNTRPNSDNGEPSVVAQVEYCIADPNDPDATIKVMKHLLSDGTYSDRILLTDIDPDAVGCC